MTGASTTRHESLEPLIELFAEDGYRVDPEGRTDRRAWMIHRLGDGFWLDLDRYGVTVIIGANRSGFGGVWAHGKHLPDAKIKFRRQGGLLNRGYTVVEHDENTLFLGVSGMGGYRWLGNEPNVWSVPARGVAK